MSALIIATGSNLGKRLTHLINAKDELAQRFELQAESQIYTSKAVDYLDQPDFYNQVLQFKLPQISAEEVLTQLLEIENKLGRVRKIPAGPRTIDTDLLFYALEEHQSPELVIPHPRLWERSFVILPLRELPFFKVLERQFRFCSEFRAPALPLAAQY